MNKNESEIQFRSRNASQPARRILDGMQSPRNALEALAIILGTESVALEEGRTTLEETNSRLQRLFPPEDGASK